MHINKDFANPAILIFARPQIDFMTANSGFLCIAFTAVRQTFTFNFADDALDHFFNDLRRCCGRHWGGDLVIFVINFVNKA